MTRAVHYRMYFLRKCRSFNVCTEMLHIFNKSGEVQSTLQPSVGAAASKSELKETIQTIMLHKLINTKNNIAHPLHNSVKTMACDQFEASLGKTQEVIPGCR